MTTDLPENSAEVGIDVQRLVLPVRLGEHPTRYYNWKMHFDGEWTKREEEIAHAAYLTGWYHRCNQDPDSMGENSELWHGVRHERNCPAATCSTT